MRAAEGDDGSRGTSAFKHSELTPRNRTESVPVAWREVDNSGHMITAELPKPFAGTGWALLVPLLGVAIMGVELPRLVSPLADQWTGRRRTARLQLWQPLVLPAGWSLLIAGGLATAAPAVLPGSAVITLLLGHFVLATAAVLGVNRRRHGFEHPPLISPESRVRCERAALDRGVGALLVLVIGFGNRLGARGDPAGAPRPRPAAVAGRPTPSRTARRGQDELPPGPSARRESGCGRTVTRAIADIDAGSRRRGGPVVAATASEPDRAVTVTVSANGALTGLTSTSGPRIAVLTGWSARSGSQRCERRPGPPDGDERGQSLGGDRHRPNRGRDLPGDRPRHHHRAGRGRSEGSIS